MKSFSSATNYDKGSKKNLFVDRGYTKPNKLISANPDLNSKAGGAR